jgi:hypothetical protein
MLFVFYLNVVISRLLYRAMHGLCMGLCFNTVAVSGTIGALSHEQYHCGTVAR